jgi:hypothetical protein
MNDSHSHYISLMHLCATETGKRLVGLAIRHGVDLDNCMPTYILRPRAEVVVKQLTQSILENLPLLNEKDAEGMHLTEPGRKLRAEVVELEQNKMNEIGKKRGEVRETFPYETRQSLGQWIWKAKAELREDIRKGISRAVKMDFEIGVDRERGELCCLRQEAEQNLKRQEIPATVRALSQPLRKLIFPQTLRKFIFSR